MKLLTIFLLSTMSLFSQYEIGRIPAPYNNEYTQLEVGPSDILWCGTWGDGVKKSSDKAVTWSNSSNGLTNPYVSDLNYKDGILLAATKDGVFKSVDEGANWVQINTGLMSLDVAGVAIKSVDTLFAATRGNGVFRSTDGGATWEEKNNGNNFHEMRFIHITPEGNILASKEGDGLIRSDDNGESWKTSQSGIFNKYLLSIKTLPNDELWISSAGEGIFQSSDDGNHWLRIERLDNLVDLNIESFTYFEHENEYYQVVGTRSKGIWYFDANWHTPLFRQTVFQWRTAHSIQTLSTGRIVVAIGSEGIGYSDTKGASWEYPKETKEKDQGINKYKLAADGANVYAAIDNKGTFKSNDYGKTWSPMGEVRDNYNLFKKFGKRLYYIDNDLIKYTENDGTVWNTLTLPDLEADYWPDSTNKVYLKYHDIYQKNNDIYVTYSFAYMYNAVGDPPNPPTENWTPPIPKNSIFYSSNNGTSWTLQDMPNNGVPIEAIEATSNGNLFASTSSGTIYSSTNKGLNWAKTAGNVVRNNFSVNFLKSNGNTLFASTKDWFYNTKDNGQTFNRVDFGLDEDLEDFLGLIPENTVKGMGIISPNSYFIGLKNNFGIYRTSDNGVNFDSINNSFPCEEIRSVANNSDGDVYFATTSIWKYANPSKLNPPLLVSPSDKTNNVSITLEDTGGRPGAIITWEETEKADVYEIQVSEFEQFYNFMYKKVHAGTSATLTDSLKYNTTYHWRVRSKVNDSYGRWSSRWEFTTELPAPTLTYPADNQVGIPTTPVFKWDNVEGAENYIVEVSSSIDFQDVVFSNTVTASTFTSATLTSPVKLNTFSQYYWRAKAISSKSESRWSEYNSFVTVTGAPTLIFPENNASEVATELIFKFKGDINANRYQIQVSSDSTFKEVALLILNRETETDSTHYFDFLQFYKTYYWRVQSVQTIEDTSGTKNYFGEWSQVWKFTTGIKPPGLLSPPNNSFDVPLVTKLEWDSFDEAVGYHVQLSKDMSFTNGLIVNDTLAELSLDIADGLLSNYELYYWRMRVILADNAAAWVSPWRFTTVMERTSSVSPNCGDTDQPLTFTIVWKEVKGAEKYKIEISKTDKFDENDIVFSREDITKDRVLIDAGLEANNTYYWRTQGYNDNNVGEWSDVCTFSTVTLGIRNIEKDFNFVAFPNPTKDKMNYEFTLPKACKVKVEIFDMSGLQVSTLCDAYLNKGQQELSWDVSNLSNGTYNLIMTVNGQSYIKLVGVSK